MGDKKLKSDKKNKKSRSSSSSSSSSSSHSADYKLKITALQAELENLTNQVKTVNQSLMKVQEKYENDTKRLI